MMFSDSVKRYLSSLFIVWLLATLALAVTGCEDFGQSPSPEPPQPEEKAEVEARPTAIRTEDRAILVVYEHLLGQAESYQAKLYLADFYATCDNWTAKSELLKDGTSVWYVVVDMASVDMASTEPWEERPYWQQAGWLVFQDGKVMPSNRLKANALRIEADLQELNLQREESKSPT